LHISMVMTTGWMAEQLGFDSQQREQIVQFFTVSGPAQGPTQCSGYQDLVCQNQSDQLSEAFMHCQGQELWSNTSTPTCRGDAVLN
jgi:hypothetical protein